MILLSDTELEILEECAGVRTPRPWGAAVGVCLEYLESLGLIEKPDNHVTMKGQQVLMKQSELYRNRSQT